MMQIGPHGHSCNDCGTRVECCGELIQMLEHENSFFCAEYDRLQITGGYRCGACQTRHDDNQEGPEPDLNGVSLAEGCERDARIGRGR